MTAATTGAASRSWFAITLVYLGGLMQGLALVSVPALSGLLRQTHGFTDAQYGALFLPQVAFTAGGAIFGGVLARKLGLKNLLWMALLAGGISQLALVASGQFDMDANTALTLLVLCTSAIGLGFGLSSASLNSYPPFYFPAYRDTALVAVHTTVGIGLAVGPLIAAPFLMSGNWTGFPALLAGFAFTLFALVLTSALPQHVGTAEQAAAAGAEDPARSASFWVLVVIAVLYAFAEGTFSNWTVIYLNEDRGLPADVAATALSVFWGALVGGRILISILVTRIPAGRVWIVLPMLMLASFLLLPEAHSARTGIALFALAGLACSGFFPLTIGRAAQRYPAHTAWVSSMLIAALMLGVGLGTFLIGPLRAVLSLEQIYRLSSVYPAVALALGIMLLVRERKPLPVG